MAFPVAPSPGTRHTEGSITYEFQANGVWARATTADTPDLAGLQDQIDRNESNIEILDSVLADTNQLAANHEGRISQNSHEIRLVSETSYAAVFESLLSS